MRFSPNKNLKIIEHKIVFFMLVPLIMVCSNACHKKTEKNTVYTEPETYRKLNIRITRKKDADEAIKQKLGEQSIESPGLYKNDHYGVNHIVKDKDDIVGHHLVFELHLNLDGNKGDYSKTQRNEIKVYGGSKKWIKGKEGTSFKYSWDFKIDSGFKLSPKFCHFFQLHPIKSGGHPLVSISGKLRKGKKYLTVSHTHLRNSQTSNLGKINWSEVIDEWLEITCHTTFSSSQNGGQLNLTIKRKKDQKTLLHIRKPSIDMWFETAKDSGEFIRPKWGVVRSIELLKKNSLIKTTEKVRVANLNIEALYRKQHFKSTMEGYP